MPLDPSIILGGRPAPIQSPLDAIGQIAQLQGIREQTEARRLAAEEARTKRTRQAQIDAALEQAFEMDPATGRPKLNARKLVGHLPAHLIHGVLQELDADEKTALDYQSSKLDFDTKRRKYLGSALQTIRAAEYDPHLFGIEVRGAQRLGAIDNETAERLLAIQDPAQIQAITESYIAQAGLTPAPKLEKVTHVNAEGQTVDEFVVPKEGAQYVQPAKAAAGVNVGSFEDYVTRYAQTKGKDVASLTPADIEDARKRYQQADDRPIVVNAAGQRLITQTAEAGLITRLNSQWTKATAPKRELAGQVTTMRAGMAAAERGDLAQGTEAVLQPFLKILDDRSVVRESEFWRLQEGQALLARTQGIVQRLTTGGFVPLSELKKYAQLAEAIATRYDGYVRGERTRIGKVADRYGIPQELVFEADTPAADTTTPTTPGSGGGSFGGSYQDYLRRQQGKK